METFREIDLDVIKMPFCMLRPVRTDTVEYAELLDSVRHEGILNSILVRPRGKEYELIDGAWRLSVCKELGLRDIPAIIREAEDHEVLGLQIAANAVTFETRPIEFAMQMSRMMRVREDAGAPMTIVELSHNVGKSASWVSTRLCLLKLCEEAQELLEKGKLTLGNAVALARVNSHDWQRTFLDKAVTMKTRDFELETGKFVQEKRFEASRGRAARRDEIKLRPVYQSMDTMLIELDNLENVTQIIVKEALETPLEGAKAALEWVLHLHEQGRDRQVEDKRRQLSHDQRNELLGRQQYAHLIELRELRELREQRNTTKSTGEAIE